jgi:hypothetical protein
MKSPGAPHPEFCFHKIPKHRRVMVVRLCRQKNQPKFKSVRSNDPQSEFLFRHWYGFWKLEEDRFQRTMRAILPDKPPKENPHEVFPISQQSLYLALQNSQDDEWYELPGPAAWWPDDYDYAGNGWEMDTDDNVKKSQIFAIELLGKGTAPPDFQNMDWDYTLFRVTPAT